MVGRSIAVVFEGSEYSGMVCRFFLVPYGGRMCCGFSLVLHIHASIILFWSRPCRCCNAGRSFRLPSLQCFCNRTLVQNEKFPDLA